MQLPRPRDRALLIGLWLLLLAPGSGTHGQPAGTPWIEHYPVSAYRGHKQNWNVEQGADGLLYVAGGSSLLVFDGVSWQPFATPNEGRIRSFHLDDDGRIWIGSEQELGWFERDAIGRLSYRSLGQEIPPSARPFGDVRQTLPLGADGEEDSGMLFLARERIFRWRDGALTVREPFAGAFRIAFEQGDRVFVLTDGGIFPLDPFPGPGAPAPPPDPRWPVPPELPVTFILPGDEDELLLGTYDQGLFLLGRGGLRPFAADPALAAAWPYCVERLSDGRLAVGTIHAGVFLLDGSGEVLAHYNEDSGLQAPTVLGMSVDHQGGLWLSQESVISRIDLGSPLRRLGGTLGLGDVEGLTRIGEDWIFAGSAGLVAWSESAGLRAIETALPEIFGILPVPPGAGAGDSPATELLAAGSGGVARLSIDLEAGIAEIEERLLEDDFAYTLVPSRHRAVVYVGTTSGLGVLGAAAGAWAGQGLVAGLTERADTIAEDGRGRVWAGTGTGAVHAFEWSAAGALEPVLSLGPEAGVPPGNAWVFPFGDEVLFATTDGAYRFDGARLVRDASFGNEQFGEHPQLFRFLDLGAGAAVAVIGSSEGDLWYGERGDDGIMAWDHRPFAHLDPGLVTELARTADETLWFTVQPELYRLPLAALRGAAFPPSRLLLRRLGYPEQEPLLAGELSERLAAGPTQALPFTPAALRFEFALASFLEPGASEYRARLLGLEDQWSDWSREPRRDYTNLPGGSYRFEVQGRDVRGVASAVTALPFSIAPPWYLTPAAKLAYGALALALLAAAAQGGQRVRARRMLGEQRRLEGQVAQRTRQVRAQAREIEALSEARARFFANVSHEFRTPLTLTRGPLRELAEGRVGTLDEAAREYVAMALRNTEVMESLIGQVLDIHRLEAGRMPLRLERRDLSEALRRSAQRFELEAERRSITLRIGGLEDPLLADFDDDHLAAIVSNLLSNALKFTPAGGEVVLALARSRALATISVSDTGPGIGGPDPERVFERYVQGDVTDPAQPGTGIGLALVRELSELHGGTVALRTAKGEGTTFTVTLPLEHHASAPERVTEAASEPASPRPASLEDVPTLLVVDDNAELRAFLRLRLQANYRIIEAEDGESALLLARAEMPDVIVSDVMMPRLDGMGLTAALKSDPETDFIPILLLSARDSKRDVVSGIDSGADDYLAKPFDTAELAARVAGLIATRRRLRERLAEQVVAAAPGQRESFLERARAVLREHLSDPTFAVNDWAELLHMDRTTLYRKLKAETDSSPETCLRDERLALAAKLLRRGAGNVGEVADAVGFGSLSHFSRRFKAKFGQTPAAWRASSS